MEIKEIGYYRISAHLTNNQPFGQGYSSLYINKIRQNGNYCHTTSIQEIVKLQEGDKIHFYSSHCYNSQNYNSFFIQKLS